MFFFIFVNVFYYLARLAKLLTGLYFLLAIYFTFRFFLFFEIAKLSQDFAISGSTGPIFTIFFSQNRRYLCECYQSGPGFLFLKGRYHGNQFWTKLAK